MTELNNSIDILHVFIDVEKCKNIETDFLRPDLPYEITKNTFGINRFDGGKLSCRDLLWSIHLCIELITSLKGQHKKYSETDLFFANVVMNAIFCNFIEEYEVGSGIPFELMTGIKICSKEKGGEIYRAKYPKKKASKI
jgi:hypothetical protein